MTLRRGMLSALYTYHSPQGSWMMVYNKSHRDKTKPTANAMQIIHFLRIKADKNVGIHTKAENAPINNRIKGKG